MKTDHPKQPTPWIISTIILGILLLALGGFCAFAINNLQTEARDNKTKLDTLTAQVSDKDAANRTLQAKYNSLESDYRKLQTAQAQSRAQAPAAAAPAPSAASRCETKYLYSSGKYVTTCN